MSAITRLLGRSTSQPEAEVLSAPRKVTLDDAHRIACQFGRPEIGSSFHGAHSAELKLNAETAGDHYVALKCHRYPTAAENLMALVEIARRLSATLKETP